MKLQASSFILAVASLCLHAEQSSGYAFVARRPSAVTSTTPSLASAARRHAASSSSLKMVDQNVIQGAAIAFAGLAAGIGLVAFTEVQGERAKERGSGLSESMSTRIAGGLLEDVEVSSVSDLGSLTSQLEQALKASGGADEEDLEMTEEEKRRIAEEADDGW